jgi:hypothetical protein
MCERPPSPLAYLSSQEDQSAQGKETRYDVTRLDILEAFGFAGPRAVFKSIELGEKVISLRVLCQFCYKAQYLRTAL